MFNQFKIKRLTKKIKTLKQARSHNQPSEDAVKKEIAFYHMLAKMYTGLQGNKKFPFAREMMLACYRASSELEDAEARFIVGKTALDEAIFRENLQREGIFLSQSNGLRITQMYEEALAYLIAAEQLNHIKAKRLHGLCYINGWGVAPDKKMGFDLILASIEQENSWEQVPHIFAELGLNKPEFYSALAQHRNTKSEIP